jgi:hypothetical protein
VGIPRRLSSSAAFRADRPDSSAKTGRSCSARSSASRWKLHPPRTKDHHGRRTLSPLFRLKAYIEELEAALANANAELEKARALVD